MKIVFIGTGDIGIPTLRRLIASTGHELLAVVTQPDKPVGRRQTLQPPEVKRIALEAGIPVYQPEKLRSPDALNLLEEFGADVFVVVAYGQILKKRALEAPRLACLNVHASLLPRHRGASPIQAAIREGDSETGVTIMYMDEGLDTGDILLARSHMLVPGETGGELHDTLAELAPDGLMEALDLLSRGEAPRIVQDPAGATHTTKLTRDDGHLDWSRGAGSLERLIRAYDPWPGTSTTWTVEGGKPKKLKIFPPGDVVDGDACADPGTVIAAEKDGILVSTGEGILRVQSLQLEGKKRLDAAAFLAGTKMEAGTRLGG